MLLHPCASAGVLHGACRKGCRPWPDMPTLPPRGKTVA
jgi:hypothetical protein